MPLYKYGDNVKIKTNGTYKIGKVIKVVGNVLIGYTCTVKFDSNIIPSEMDFPDHYLEPHEVGASRYVGSWRFSGDNCPICKQAWHEVESPMFGKKEIWKDCLKCKKTKEQLMKEMGK